MNKQDLVDSISHQTGISKRDLAVWIGTHHSILSRYLAGTRSLPVAAVQQLLAIHQLLSELPPATTAPPTAAAQAEWKAQAAAGREKLNGLQGQYNAMLLAKEKAVTAWKLVEAMSARELALLTPKKQRWVAEQCYQAEKELAANDIIAQQKLALQITLQQKEIEFYEALAGEA